MRTADLVFLMHFCAFGCWSQSTLSHRIGVRTVNGVGQLYDRQTGSPFTARGNNFIRLASQTQADGIQGIFHSTFNVGAYDAAGAESALSQMQGDGYNTVRVFTNGCCVSNTDATQTGINSAYVSNLVDFLLRAKQHRIFVILTGDDLPRFGIYWQLATTNCCAQFAAWNMEELSQGGVTAFRRFWGDLVAELIRQDAPLDAILSYDIKNEIYFDGDQPPLSLGAGSVTAANGTTYDMGSPVSKQALMDDGLVYLVNQVREAIMAIDPTALVDGSFFWPATPNPARIGDPRLIQPLPAMNTSELDFVDLHAYPDAGLTLQRLSQNYQLSAWTQSKPIIMGEFGGQISDYSSSASAASVFQHWQVGSCSLQFSGWLLWTWDLVDSSNAYWTALSGNGEIDNALKPFTRPDACQAGAYLGQNLALGATTSASNTWTGTSPGSGGPMLAIDGNVSTFWNSGGFPPQWIEIDLPVPSIVSGVRLTVDQFPSGPTVHDLYVQSEAGGQPQVVTEFSGTTQDQQVLTWTPSRPLVGVTSVRVTTVSSPSFVAWREIEILSGDSGQPTISSVVNGASFDAAITPGSWVTIYGTGLAASSRLWQASDFNGAELPTVLDGVRVSIDGAAASVYYISPTQLNVQAPAPIHTGQTVAVTVARDNVQVAASAKAESKAYDPALFAYTAAGSLYVAAVFPDGTVVGDPSKTSGTRGASPGDYVSLYGTGFGASPSGVVINSPTALSNPVVSVGGQAATVKYAGLVGAGLFQINIVVPDLPVGDYPVAIQFQGATATTSPSIPIR
jgi:uncharacterized protein (TIGR03437 family)